MAADRYLDALARVLVHEGGYANNPADPGGATMSGVTQRTFDGYLRLGKASRPVRTITSTELGEIYRRQYWAAVKGDELPEGIDYVLFDGAVNSGPAQSIKWLQRALGVRVDGVLGEATIDAVEAHPDHDLLIAAVLDRRMKFLRALKHWSEFRTGWTRRVDEVRRIGQAWATGSVGPQPTYVAGMERRASLLDAKSAPSLAVADAVTGGGLLSTVIDQTTTALNPLAEHLPSVGTVVGVLTAAGGVAMAGGMLYRWYATRKANALTDALDLHRDTAPVSAAAPEPVEPADVAVPVAPIPEAGTETNVASIAALQMLGSNPASVAALVAALTPKTVVELPPGTEIPAAAEDDQSVVAVVEQPIPATPAPAPAPVMIDRVFSGA